MLSSGRDIGHYEINRNQVFCIENSAGELLLPGMTMWLGVDLGTQSVRAVVASETGSVLAQSSRRLTSRHEGPRHEQDPEQWWRAFVGASREVLAKVSGRSVKGLAIDGTSGTILLVDQSGRALTPGLMYDDSRAQAEAEELNEAGSVIWNSLGYRMQPSWALPKLVWLLREHGELVAGARLAHEVDFINWRLAGCGVASDWSNALKTGYDLINERWPHEILDALGVPGRIMPTVARPGTQVGTVCAKAATPTGIPAGTPIIAGMTDGCAAQIGTGALEVGDWNSVLGTTLVLKGVSSNLICDPGGVIYSHRSPDGNWLPGGASNTGAGILAQRFPGRDLDALSAKASERGLTDVVAYPLVSSGERFPFSAPQAEGFFLGNPSDEVELYTALLQGVGFIERLCFDYLDMLGAPVDGELTLSGGATRSRYWCQLRADILGRPVRLPENAEPAFGMAVLAASAGRNVFETAKQMVRVRETIDPQPDHVVRLAEPYLRLVEELAKRGWLSWQVAHHARQRIRAQACT